MKKILFSGLIISLIVSLWFNISNLKEIEPVVIEREVFVGEEYFEEDIKIAESIENDSQLRDNSDTNFVILADVIPDIIQEIRYYSTFNFVGRRIHGYEEPVAIMVERAAYALKKVSDELSEQGYRLKVFDAYRPMSAVRAFVKWANDPADTLTKQFFYPDINKSDVFRLGYISSRSAHARGATIDLTLFDMKSGKEVDMGGVFDYFGAISSPNYKDGLTETQYNNRMLLRNTMKKYGFRPVTSEWWHFRLENEPYPDRYFDFPVNSTAYKTIN